MTQQYHYWAYTLKKTIILKDACTLNIHCSTIYNSQDMEETLMSIDRLMDKEVVVHIYNGILLSHSRE